MQPRRYHCPLPLSSSSSSPRSFHSYRNIIIVDESYIWMWDWIPSLNAMVTLVGESFNKLSVVTCTPDATNATVIDPSLSIYNYYSSHAYAFVDDASAIYYLLNNNVCTHECATQAARYSHQHTASTWE